MLWQVTHLRVLQRTAIDKSVGSTWKYVLRNLRTKERQEILIDNGVSGKPSSFFGRRRRHRIHTVSPASPLIRTLRRGASQRTGATPRPAPQRARNVQSREEKDQRACPMRGCHTIYPRRSGVRGGDRPRMSYEDSREVKGDLMVRLGEGVLAPRGRCPEL